MLEHKAIAIPKDWGIDAFADALEATLEQLASERWASRLFQLGPEGLLVLAHRTRDVALEGLDESSPDWMMGEAGDEEDDLEPAVREMLEKVFDLLGPVPMSEALEGMSSAMASISKLYPVRFLADAWTELCRHHEAHLSTHEDDGASCEYAQVVGAAISALQLELRSRIS